MPTETKEKTSALSIRVPAKLVLPLLSIALAALVAEAGLRMFKPYDFPPFENERALAYEYHETLGWFPPRNSTRQFTASRAITVSHNRNGFRAGEQAKDDRPGILVLGDSFVWGFDVEADERFTDKLQARHPEWNIFNLGVCAYGTDQEFLLLQKYFDQFQPRVVLLVFCADNDRQDNSCNVRGGGYYKPYYTLNAARELVLEGVPVPRSERAICAAHRLLCRSYLARLCVRTYCKLYPRPRSRSHPDPTLEILQAMNRFVTNRGAFFVVGFQKTAPELEAYLRDQSVATLDLTTTNCYPLWGSHWNPEGHTDVCNKLDAFLVAAKEQGRWRADSSPSQRDVTSAR